MNIAIVGAGIVGISTAYALARDGHQVTVYEQRNAVAEDASFAAPGWLSPTLLQPWSTPGMGLPLLQQRRHRDNLLRASSWPGRDWLWQRRWRRAERLARRHSEQTPPMALALEQLASYSQSLRWEDGAEPEQQAERRVGHLVLLRSEAELTQLRPALQALEAADVRCTVLDAAQARQIEPGIAPEYPLWGALHLPDGESINLRLWTQQLRQAALALGVHFRLNAQVIAIQSQPVRLTIEGQGTASHDALVLCTGAAAELLPGLGLRLPLMPLYGYTVSAPLRDALQAPRSSVLDWQQQACITRLGQRVRISGGAELGGAANAPHHQPTLERLYRLLNDCFPGGALLSSPQVQIWRGARALLPDGAPVLGASPQPGIWLNLGHGTHGAALAAGSAQLLADLIAQRPAPEVLAHFSADRFR